MRMHRRASYLLGFASLITFCSASAAFAFDSDGDGVDDVFDVCCNTPPGVLVDADGRPIGDFDLDCDNDLADFAFYMLGFTGPLSGPTTCTCVSSIDCDDGNGCTVDVCTFGACVHTDAGAGSSCDDGDACTVADVCDGSGTCVGVPTDCSGLDSVCTEGVCNPSTGVCEVSVYANGTACSDGDPCTTGGVCSGGTCVSSPLGCDDFNPCTLDACSAGTCIHAPLTGNACDDGMQCTVSDVCNASGICEGMEVDCSGLDTQCADGACVAATGLCDIVPKPDGLGCDDGDINTVGDQCINGECVGTIP
ncbi:MAG: hypothetical protein R3E58_15210 [Phycisphaerae bacterium]|nr:hypothetical protein [Phycisphaerales bacterium]